jgi:superfamily II DNA or RNA helicase
VTSHGERFDRMWNNQEPNLKVFKLPDAIKQNLAELRHRSPRPYLLKPHAKIFQDWKWRHQSEAERKFIAARRGVLEMATGTGKTRTAIRITDTLYKSQAINSAIVVAFGTDLLDQWYRELNAQGKWVVSRHYEINKDLNKFLLHPHGGVLIISRQMFKLLLDRYPAAERGKTLVIFDEVHGIGSPALVRDLSGRLAQFGFRLGLSATPEREYDPEGNQFIEREIGPVIYRFGLEDAIKRGILCEFDYVPLEYQFSADDKADIQRVYARYHAKVASGEDPGKEVLYQELGRVRKLSKNKLPVFNSYLQGRPQLLHRTIIFVETSEYGVLVQKIILQISGNYHTYYADDQRENLINFATGALDSLITCHRISEGIDVQSTNNIVLFSAARARLETIQRMGRCLRVDPANPNKRAVVIDFIRTDREAEEGQMPSADDERRQWLSELAQVRKEEVGHE